MELPINWIAVVGSLVASMILAVVWYSDTAFGLIWRRLTGVTPEDSEKAGMMPMVIVLVANIVTIVALAIGIHIAWQLLGGSYLVVALVVGFAAWVAFSLTTLLTHNLFEQKSYRLTMINGGYQLALFMISAAIIGVVA